MISYEDIFHVEKEGVSYASEAYACCGDDSLQLHSAFFFAQNS